MGLLGLQRIGYDAEGRLAEHVGLGVDLEVSPYGTASYEVPPNAVDYGPDIHDDGKTTLELYTRGRSG